MTNLEKFIEMMNKIFNARMKPENMELHCSPCGTLKKYNHACKIFSCEKCKAWWHKEYHPVGISHDELTVLAFALRYAAPRHTYAPRLVCDYIKTKLPLMTEEQRLSIRDEVVTENMGFVDELSAQALQELMEEIDKYGTDKSEA